MSYYIVAEYKYGQTVGKIITKTKVISEGKEKLSIRTILFRTLSRLIPFDAYSFVHNDKGWHDKLSKTKVIYLKSNNSSETKLQKQN